MTFVDLSLTLWRRRVAFLTTFFLVLGTVAVVTAMLPKRYSTTAYLLVSQEEPPSSTFEATQINETLIRTYAQLLQTRNTAERAVGALPFEASVDEVLAAVDVAAVSQSQLLSVSAEAGTPERARDIANTYAEQFAKDAGELVVSGANNGKVELAQPAPIEPHAVKPRPVLYLIVGAIVAALLAAAVSLLRHRLDQGIEIEGDGSEVLGLPIIGRIPQRSRRHEQQVAEAFRLILANLAFVNHGQRPRSVAVVSSRPEEGKSTTSINLARMAAELGISVVLVETDLRRPSLSRTLELEPSGGFTSFLASDAAMAVTDITVTVPGTSLHIVPAGGTPPNPSALLGSPRLKQFDERARRMFDLVIYDTPPLTVGPDASLVAAVAEGVLVVLDPGQSRRNIALRALDQLHRTQAHVLGVALNRVSPHETASYYYAGEAPPESGTRERESLGIDA